MDPTDNGFRVTGDTLGCPVEDGVGMADEVDGLDVAPLAVGL